MRLYKLLGVAKSASKQDIKQAYRKLALQFHPDKHTQSPKPTRDAAADKFKQMSAAYEILVDDRRRAAYDRIADANQTPPPPPPPPPPQYKRREYRQAYTYESKQYGGSKKSGDKEEISWPRLLLSLGMMIILSSFADALEESIYEGERVRLQKKHESEVEELRKSHECELEEHRARQARQLEEHGTRHPHHELRESYQRELEMHRKRHQDQLDKQQRRHERECKELRKRQEREREERRKMIRESLKQSREE